MGVLGSAFNPPHVGHLQLAERAADQLALERALLMPTRLAPHKTIEDDPGPVVRAELARRAVACSPRLEVSELELRRDGPSYTYETLEELSAQEPEAELVWLMGADAALGLGSWKRPRRIVELARIAVAARDGVAPGVVDEVLKSLGASGERARALPIEMPPVAVSSSMVRERVRAGESIEELVPEPVAELIAERGLYGGG